VLGGEGWFRLVVSVLGKDGEGEDGDVSLQWRGMDAANLQGQ
jgi:hypothetical protein